MSHCRACSVVAVVLEGVENRLTRVGQELAIGAQFLGWKYVSVVLIPLVSLSSMTRRPLHSSSFMFIKSLDGAFFRVGPWVCLPGKVRSCCIHKFFLLGLVLSLLSSS